ncbi:hypothetical protein TRFO_06339 [Tritrichomonas foetus]|uniref:RCC1-like domain-containing protein n=1 Tax=Tritrichomonas foetus TaxID=1144522 RepID=A0A1J4JZ42_9EUKA|nr:hypothetical protein TRFO_06339 [Tritrichomonas foetus]|eukprot:OHT04439.1 hypothetical protein TRFO_06339 [Tritrichomonas foetus]
MSIWTCGPEDGNRLGRQRSVDDPDKIPIPEKLTIVQIAIGWKHGHFFTDKNDFYSWGTGTSWRLGTGTRCNLPTPQKVTTFPPDTKFKQIACGDKFSAVTTQGGQLIVWGSGYAHTPTVMHIPSPAQFIACGQICLLVALSDGSVMQFYRHLPSVHHHFEDERIISVACGANHKLALSESGKVYSWGTSPATGQGGVELPRVIASLVNTPMCGIFAYHNSSFFLDTQYRVWCCGTNSSGSLGLGHIDDVGAPIPQEFSFNNEQIVQIACGDDFTLYLTVNGNVWASGNGGDNRNATGSNETRTRPAPATKLTGKFITQIAAGCFNSAFLENGCPPFNHMMQFRGNFADFPVPQLPYRTTMHDKINVEIDPSSEAVKKFGFLPSDIIMFQNNEKAKVIGVTSDHVAVIREEKNQICVLPEDEIMDVVACHPLLYREGANLATFKCDSGFEIAVDSSPDVTLPHGGFLKDDVVQDITMNSSNLNNETNTNQNDNNSNNANISSENNVFTVVGVRLGFVWAKNKENIISRHKVENLKILQRKDKSIKQFTTMDDKLFVVEITDDANDLVYSETFGVGFFTGTIGNKFCYTFVCSPDKILILNEKLPFARRHSTGDTAEYTTVDFKTIQLKISCLSTSQLGFYRFDRVKYITDTSKNNSNIKNTSNNNNNGSIYTYGIVVGVCDGKVGVRSDKQMIGSGFVEMIEPSSLTLIGRINIDGFLRIGEINYNVNSSNFTKTNFLPGDRIMSNGKKGVIVGFYSENVYVMFDGENEPAILPENTIKIASFLQADSWQQYEKVTVDVSLMHCAMLHMKPGDRVTTMEKRKARYLGFDKKNELWFKYEDNDEESPIKLCEIDPDSYVFDQF